MRKQNYLTNQIGTNKLMAMNSLVGSLIIILVVWGLTAMKLDQAVILPGPALVFKRMVALIGEPGFTLVMMGSIIRALKGFIMALVAGIFFGMVSGFSMNIRYFMYPWIQLLRAVPVMSIVLYLLLFVPTEDVSIWVSFFIVFPIVFTNTIEGIATIDEKLIQMATLYKVGRMQQIKEIYLPHVLPFLSAAAVSGMGLNIKAVITAEAMALPEYGIGSMLVSSRNYLDTEAILAWTLWIMLTAVVLDLIVMGIYWMVGKGRRYVVLRQRLKTRL